MTVIKAVYKILDSLPFEQMFSGWELKNWSKIYFNPRVDPYIATVLRVMRRWRKDNRKIMCINNKKSLYVILEDR